MDSDEIFIELGHGYIYKKQLMIRFWRRSVFFCAFWIIQDALPLGSLNSYDVLQGSFCAEELCYISVSQSNCRQK